MGFFDSLGSGLGSFAATVKNTNQEVNKYKQHYMGMSRENLKREIQRTSGNKRLGAMAAYKEMYGENR